MKIGYLLDTHAGPYNMPLPNSAQARAFIDHLWREAEVAEQAGFDSLVVPERHTRTECLFPSPIVLLSGLATFVAVPSDLPLVERMQSESKVLLSN